MKDTGGSAFPATTRLELLHSEGIPDQAKEVIYVDSNGMTLRDYFSAKALQGVLSNEDCNTPDAFTDENAFSNLAKDCYKLADAMLAERNKP